jgi:ribosomal protein L37AE/L43A
MASSDLHERTKDYPACPVCEKERTVPRRPQSPIFTCSDCGMVFATSETGVSFLGPDAVSFIDQ